MSNHCPATCHSYTLEPEAGFSLITLKAGEKMVIERGDSNCLLFLTKVTSTLTLRSDAIIQCARVTSCSASAPTTTTS